MANTYLVTSAVVAVFAMALGAAYMAGLLDPVIEQVGVMFFEAKAKGEEKKMEAKGMKEGELKGNQQAQDVKEGLGGVGGLKAGGLYGNYGNGEGIIR
ncbi:hypothetical protein LAWI1_G001477 [Lachnellula willkommii]|uniref:Uncharacterized protein n=1 Tax=Lachnellula willkommii TaxID=215461 RepID=A0A559MKC0_9HELO|nr:hypothetical protein LAWI1_G001477 [Lachnellula willkommii]